MREKRSNIPNFLFFLFVLLKDKQVTCAKNNDETDDLLKYVYETTTDNSRYICNIARLT